MNKRAMKLTLAAAIVLLAAALRVWFAASEARDSLWGDEIQELGIVRSSDSIGELIDKVDREGHAPLEYLLVYPFRGASDEALRALPIAFGILSVVTLMALAHRFFGSTCGLLCGFFMAVGPYFIYYTTEIRVYSLFLFLGLLFGWAFLRFVQRPSRRTAVVWGASTALLAYAHYYAFHMAFAAGLFALLILRGKRHLVLLAGGIGALLFLPWLPTLIEQTRNDLTAWYTPTHDPSRIRLVAELPFGRLGAWLVALCVWRSVVDFFRGEHSTKEANAYFGLLTIAFGGATLAWIAQLFQSPFLPRYFTGMAALLLPCVCLLLARAIEGRPHEFRLPRRPIVFEGRFRQAFGTLLIAAAVAIPWTEPWGWTQPACKAKGIARHIEELGRPGDLIWLGNSFDALSFAHYYRGGLPIVDIPYRGVRSYVDWVDLKDQLEDDVGMESLWNDLEERLAAGGRVLLLCESWWPTTLDDAARFAHAPLPRLYVRLIARHRTTLERLHARARPTSERQFTGTRRGGLRVTVFER